MISTNEAQFPTIDGPNGKIAYQQVSAGNSVAAGIVWLGGFKSDMSGTKAEFLSDWAKMNGRGFLRFDYSGHGASEGAFEDGCLSDWIADANVALEQLTDGPQILVGSSMGAWIAAHLALRFPKKIVGIVFIAPAPDFTEKLMLPAMSEEKKAALFQNGQIEEPTEYSDEPNIITRKLIEDGRDNLLMNNPIPVTCPIRILQGMADPDVPYRHALDFAECIQSKDLEITLTKTGDHRLSTPEDLARLATAVGSI